MLEMPKPRSSTAAPLPGPVARWLAVIAGRPWAGVGKSGLLLAGATAMWAATVFASSETSIALLTSTPGDADHNVLLNPQIAAAREVVDRYAGAGRVKTHTIVHPNVGPAELDRMGDLDDALRPSGWKCYPLYGPPTAASPTGGWFLDDDEIGFPFLERVRNDPCDATTNSLCHDRPPGQATTTAGAESSGFRRIVAVDLM